MEPSFFLIRCTGCGVVLYHFVPGFFPGTIFLPRVRLWFVAVFRSIIESVTCLRRAWGSNLLDITSYLPLLEEEEPPLLDEELPFFFLASLAGTMATAMTAKTACRIEGSYMLCCPCWTSHDSTRNITIGTLSLVDYSTLFRFYNQCIYLLEFDDFISYIDTKRDL